MNFRLKHFVYPVRQECKLHLESVFPVRVDPQQQYDILVLPFSGLRRYGLRHTEYVPTKEDEVFFSKRHPLQVENEQLVLDIRFPQEDCYICRVYIGEEKVEEMEIYALEEDLLRRNPYKGDNHMHTYMSDGMDSPVYMAGAACRSGYDYCVITDHHRYEPSLIAKDFFGPSGVDFLVIPGEEVHSPDNPVHIINLGGNQSVNEWWKTKEEEYRAAVLKEQESITDPMTDADRYATAASQVIFDRIKAVDGVSVLCHPGWVIPNGLNEHEDITDYLFDHRRFDVLELIAGGAYEEGTQMQISYYNDYPNMPILGSSDTHGCFGSGMKLGNYTIVFADKLEENAIKDSIRTGYTVAADDKKFYGDYRLVKYAYFLLRNYFPLHREKRLHLGAAMLRAASGMPFEDPRFKDTIKKYRPSEEFELWKYR